jgi:hypothetical protein
MQSFQNKTKQAAVEELVRKELLPISIQRLNELLKFCFHGGGHLVYRLLADGTVRSERYR